MRGPLLGLLVFSLLPPAADAETHHGKVPTWMDLNEESGRRGGEGRERYRLVATLSVLF